MSATITFDRTKKNRLFKKLRELAPEADKFLEAAAGKSSAEMVQMARALVPVDTGKLRDSIVATPPGGHPPAYSQGTDLSVVPDGAWMVSAGNTGVRYPHLVEFGTKPHENAGEFAGTMHPGTKAQPYFFPSYRVTKKRHRARAGKAISQSIKKVAK